MVFGHLPPSRRKTSMRARVRVTAWDPDENSHADINVMHYAAHRGPPLVRRVQMALRRIEYNGIRR